MIAGQEDVELFNQTVKELALTNFKMCKMELLEKLKKKKKLTKKLKSVFECVIFESHPSLTRHASWNSY